ncbi:Gfo/Idh/MocA family oxidoreductase [Pararhodonellum marinum]|uniref:Gfo/Idh/MocA family oxidoreductase n=1 Tax=Pararhodonellum marinum TaxID=2755358 RepID=UPI00189090B5|nr:Gfo/Idh/MocA family oxidoreductase [Pararhodonellum marinum]
MKTFSPDRRQFLKGSAATLALASMGLMGMDYIRPEQPLQVALIGTGWYGKMDLWRLIQVAEVEVVALCDVDQNHLREAAEMTAKRHLSGRKPKTYSDYRELLANHQLDIVLICTPDHWHALQAIAAMKAGAHVYLQKPISVDVIEGEAVVAAAKKYNKQVQIGTQRRSTPHLIEAKKTVIDSGKLGKISHAEICCYFHMRANRNPDEKPVPAFLDYDFWTGPAPLRPYDDLPHRGWWRAFMEYGNGIVGDMCVHMLDAVRWMLDLGWPHQVSSTGGIYVQKASKSNTSDTQTAIFEFNELNVVWQHRTWGNPVDPEYPWAFKIYGEKGMLAGSPFKADFFPTDPKEEKIHWEALYEREKYPEDTKEEGIEIHAVPATRRHLQNLLESVSNGQSPVADVMEGHISTASCILANLSMKLGRPLHYDPVKMEIPGDPEATALLRRPYRSPWVHPEPDQV